MARRHVGQWLAILAVAAVLLAASYYMPAKGPLPSARTSMGYTRWIHR